MSMQDYEKELDRPVVKLSGTDGNALAVISKVKRALEKAGYMDKEDIAVFLEDAMSGDYDHLLRVCMEYVDIE